MRMFSTVSLVVLAGVLSAGCLQKEVAHTIYVSGSGATWSVIEKDVRSDEQVPARRIAEEHDYVLAARAGRHPVAQAFRRLGAQAVTTTWLREQRPYTVLTEGRFADLRALATAVLRESQARGDATLAREGTRSTLTVRIDVTAENAGDDDTLDALLADLGDYRVVLSEGRFISAVGFTIESDGAVARPDVPKTPEDGMLILRLVWDDTPR